MRDAYSPDLATYDEWYIIQRFASHSYIFGDGSSGGCLLSYGSGVFRHARDVFVYVPEIAVDVIDPG